MEGGRKGRKKGERVLLGESSAKKPGIAVLLNLYCAFKSPDAASVAPRATL